MSNESKARAPSGARVRRQGALASTLPPRYRRQAWLAVAALVLFMLAYAVLAGWFLRTAWRLSFGGAGDSGGRVWGLLAAACAALLAAFMIKGLFFIRRGKPEGLTELRAEDQPRLFRFLHDLADQAGAPRPHKVYVSARVNAAVFYDLSLLNFLLPSRKNLEIGLSLVNVLALGEFRAVLAHEFGHFAQRSMAVGRWVYIAQQVTAQLIARRDKLDAFVAGLSRMDFRVAWVGWILQTVVWAIRSLIELAFRGVLLMQRALSREMELQADLVAVSLTGSDALVHALSRLQAADDGFDRALSFAQSERAKGTPPRDLFELQTQVMKRVGALLDDPSYGRVPLVPLEDPGAHRVFKAELTQPPRMWQSHPANHEREANAKKTYIAAPLDERPAWVLFDDAGGLRERITAAVLEHGDVAPAPAADTLARLHARFDRSSLDRRYHGVYLGRAVARASADLATLYGAGEGQAADVERLYPKTLAADVAQCRQLDRELDQLRGLEAGVVEASGGTIRYRGDDIARRGLPALIERVAAERDEVRARLDEHEQWCRRTFIAAARAADAAAAASGGPAGGATHESALRGLLAVIHYAEHGEAVVRDLKAAVATSYRMVTGGGKITQEKLQPLLLACNHLQQACAKLHEERAHVVLAPGVLEGLGAASWSEAFGSFDLPLATQSNLQKWLEVIDGWADKTTGGLSGLRGAALDELLRCERALGDFVRHGTPPEPVAVACLVPAGYRCLTLAQERAHRVELTPWQRFLQASGWGMGAARLAVAGGIVGTVLVVGAGIGHATLVVYDALTIPVTVHVGDRVVHVASGVPETLELEPDAQLAIETTTQDGRLVERLPLHVGGAFGTQVYNVAGASPLVVYTATYGPASPQEPIVLGAPRLAEVSADHLFEDPPRTVSTKHGEGAVRRVLRGGAGERPENLLAPLGSNRAEIERVALVHARWDRFEGDGIERWLAVVATNKDTPAVVAQRLREQPDDVGLLRMEEALAPAGAAHDAVCARDRTRAERKPDDPDVAYVAIRCIADAATRDEAFRAAYRRWPSNAWLANAAAWVDAENDRWREAIAEFEQARAARKNLRDESVLMEARMLRMGQDAGSLARLATALPRLARLLDIEEPGYAGRNDDGPLLRAYAALAHGRLELPATGGDIDGGERARLLRLVAASDDAPPQLVSEALALPVDQGLDVDTLWISAGLALREHQGLDALQAEFERQVPPGMADLVAKRRRQWALLRDAARPSARPLDAEALRGFDPEERGHLYAALAVALGPKAPEAYRLAANRLLFATERPHFNNARKGVPT